MYKIGVVGDRESVMCFMSVGFAVFEETEPREAAKRIRRMAGEDYAVIFVTEQRVEAERATLRLELARDRGQAVPAVIVIPGRTGNVGYGIEALNRAVERAVGADIGI